MLQLGLASGSFTVASLATCVTGLCAIRQVSLDPHKAVRIGEASNPGPAAPNMLQELLKGLDVKSMLRDMLQQLLREMMVHLVLLQCRDPKPQGAQEEA